MASDPRSPTPPSADRVKMVVYSKSPTEPPVMAALVRQLDAQKDRLEFEVVKEPASVSKAVERTTMTVLILTLHRKEELVDVLNVLTAVSGRIQSGLCRAMVLNGMNHPRVIALLKAKGVQEILDFQTSIKALNHKIKNAYLVVTQTFQRMRNQNVRASTVVGADGDGGGRRARNESTSEVQWEKPTDHPGDVWWIPSAKNLRNVMGRWLIDMLGPGPAAGTWEETKFERSGERGWLWRPRVSTDTTFLPRAGRWIFFGRQPEFVWQKNLWAFVAKMPYLAFYAEGRSESEFVRIDSPTATKLKVFENSEVSRSFLPKVQASLEASLKLSKAERNGATDVRGNFEPGASDASVGMDFMPAGAVPAGTAAAEYAASGGGEPPEAAWNDHTGAVGFGFKAKDLRVDAGAKKGKWRNALTKDEALGEKLGLADIRQSGLTAGAKTFEKMTLEIRPVRRNGAELVVKVPILVIEMTAARAAFEFPRVGAVLRDQFEFQVEFRLGDVEKKFDLEWIVESVQSVEGAGMLVAGLFTGGALAELAEILRLAAQRQLELRDFFQVAKGA